MMLALDRRRFLQSTAVLGGGLLLGAAFPAAAESKEIALNAWVRIGTDDRVTLLLSQTEMGQGISTTLPAILADELGADWSLVHVEEAPVEPAYRNPIVNLRFTGNSMSVQAYAALMRRMGAAAREMLVAAAAQRWGVDPATCRVADGAVLHEPSGRRARFGELAEAAAKLPVPENPTLKPDGELKLVGQAVPRRDIPAKVDGSAVFGLDIKVPGMVYAALRQAPSFGGSVAGIDDAAARHMAGVLAVVALPAGVAVVAQSFWQAKTAVDALDIRFDDGPNATLDSARLMAQYRAALENGPWVTPVAVGDSDAAFTAAAKTFTQVYEAPFQAHAPMEPMNATAHVTAAGCTIWAPIQSPEATLITLAQTLGLPPEKIEIHGTQVGGGFGRRLSAEFVAQAAVLSQAVERPVKLIWTREEDMTHDMYRPATLQRISAALDAQGRPTALAHRLVSPSILQFVYPTAVTDTLDPSCLEGLKETRYAIPTLRADFHLLHVGVPTSVLRTTSYGTNLFAIESFVDELAHAAGEDPYRYRRALLAGDARALAVLDMAAAKAQWSEPPPAGRHRGIAFAFAFGTLIAQVVELSVTDNTIKLHRVVTVADAGKVFDPGIGTSNLEGGVVWGLTSALKGEITFARGRAVQSNFDGYELLHLYEMPELETYLFGGGEGLGGLGEVGPVAIPPAVANAVFAATGRRLRSIPLTRHGYAVG